MRRLYAARKHNPANVFPNIYAAPANKSRIAGNNNFRTCSAPYRCCHSRSNCAQIIAFPVYNIILSVRLKNQVDKTVDETAQRHRRQSGFVSAQMFQQFVYFRGIQNFIRGKKNCISGADNPVRACQVHCPVPSGKRIRQDVFQHGANLRVTLNFGLGKLFTPFAAPNRSCRK